jgi:hypothetical protein
MSPELGFVLFVALLWGPTALWLVFRTLRGPRGRIPENLKLASERREPPRSEPEPLVGPDEFWSCVSCRSLNRREANRCYRCRTAKGSVGGRAPSELPVSPGVPVMAEGIARSSGGLPVSPGVPVMAEGITRSSGQLAGTTRALAAPANAASARDTPVRAAELVLPAAPPRTTVSEPICPFLGLRNDPSTRYDFPDPANLCHAASSRRAQPVALEHQDSHCLAAAHDLCARYPTVEMASPNR